MKEYVIKTQRLGLRNWLITDLAPFVEMSQDEDVMEFFPKLLNEEESKNFIERMQLHFQEHGFCYFAVDELATGKFIGFVGMLHQNFKSNYTPSVDIGWRLSKSAWGKGFASEAAQSCLDYAFSELKLNEVYAFATVKNKNSEAVMKKIGMNYIDTFNHPYLNDYPELKACLVYTKNKHE